MWISYSDSEVNCFHPICEKALNNALEQLGLDNEYRVLHHQYTGSLEMDYVIQNISSEKYLCVIEVKRTPSDVHSARYQFQAMSYVQMNAEQSEKPFYILTNLEYAFDFRYDANRPRVFQQMLKPGLSMIGSFSNDEEDVFISKLTEYFKTRISSYSSNTYEYLVTLDEFASHIESIKENPKQWKSHLAILLYEYIRGAFTFLNRNDLPDVRVFHNDISKICNEAARINFKEIFNYSEELFDKHINVSNSELSDLFDFGNQNVTGDSVSGILHQIVSLGNEHNGEVPTDLELGRIVGELAKYVNGNLDKNDLLCDPAAGSGNLISSAIEVFGLNPTQILVNDWNSKLLELLSLRLGLKFAKVVSQSNSPSIYNKNISDLNREFFDNVKVVVMNPPFVAGINCVERKKELYKKIKLLTGSKAITHKGQMPLEAVFLELVACLLKPGTTLACVFPKTHLVARGIEAQQIRNLLINKFGLRLIFSYPGEDIFKYVLMDTCVLVGKVSQPADNIEVMSSYDKIPNIDTHRFSQTLSTDFAQTFTTVMPGVLARIVDRNVLSENIIDGWRLLNSEMVDAITFVNEHIKHISLMTTLDRCGITIKRGGAANNGGSDIMFFDSREDLYSQFESKKVVLKAGMRNAKLDSFVINGGDSKFLDVSVNDKKIIDEIIDFYLTLPPRAGKQKRKQKSTEQWFKILKRESKGVFSSNSVLIPRNIRRKGRVYLSEEEVFVSTNFFVCKLPSYKQALLLSTWMSTIFYQLICEVSSKDQEGTRKMEANDINLTYVPHLEMISETTFSLLENEKDSLAFLDLQSPQVRNVDMIWAQELFGEEAEEKLEEAKRLLSFLANKRNS